MKKKNAARFELGQQVYLVIDRSEWQVTHVIIDINGQITYRISNGCEWAEVYEQQLTDEIETKKIGFK